MAGPTVTLTFAGDSAKLEKAFDAVGDSAKGMSSEVKSSGASFDKATEGFDTVDTRAMGFRDTMTGVQDSMAGAGAIARGDLFEGFFLLGTGVGDLASGFVNLLVPGLKRAVTWLSGTKVGTIAVTVAQGAARVATVAWAVAMRVLNAVMRANPIGIVITVLAALVGLFVLAWNRSATFRRIVTGAWNAVKSGVTAMWRGVRSAWSSISSFVGGAVSGIKGFLSGMWDGIVGGAKAAINAAIRFINGAIRGINNVTGAVGIPGIPEIPILHKGGIVPGVPGSETLALLQAGERVTPAGQVARQPQVVRVDLGEEIMGIIRRKVRAQGGNVQIVLGQ